MPPLWRDLAAGLSELCLGTAGLGCAYMILAAMLVARFVRSRPAPPAAAGPPPGVTVLKPLYGDEPGLSDHLASFCFQDYSGPVQVVFGIQSRTDPALLVAEGVMAAFPDRDLALVVDPSLHGSNRKVSNLINMAVAIRHDIVVVADSDMRVGPGYLSRVVAELEQPGVGGVTCLYHGEVAAAGIWARLSALGINGHFLPNVIVGVSLGLARPCFGSTVALRRGTLDEIGGFEAFANALADDYAIGAALRRAGHRVAIPPITLGHACAHRTSAELRRQEVRWARTVRMIHPLGFAGTLFSYPLAWALVGATLAGFGAVALWIAAAAFASRVILCKGVERTFELAPQPLWLIPLRDVLSFAVFFRSFVGDDVSWKGHNFHVLSDGTLIPEQRSPRP